MYRSSLCTHCRRQHAERECDRCGLWSCTACVSRCTVDHTSWTGRCRDCDQLYPDDQRRDVLDDGDGSICCPQCGWTRRLRRLELVTDPDAAALHAAPACTCGRRHDATANLVLHVLAGNQLLYHLLCECGRTLASAATTLRDL